MRLRSWISFLFFVSIIANYAIPYLVLPYMRRFSGTFLFWISISLFVIALVITTSWGWRE
ncbi:MAG: hypothetical protein QXW19_03305 [Candidatus Bathyarchaeia archaeon]